MATNNTVNITVNGREVTMEELFAAIATCGSVSDPKPAKTAPKKAKKTAPAPKNQPKGPWYEDIVHAKWVKEWKTSDMSSIVKVRPEAGHGPELRAAGFRPQKGNQWWWAYKDYAKAKAYGEKYLANKAAREVKVA